MRSQMITMTNVVRIAIDRTNVADMVALRALSSLAPRYLHVSPERGYSSESPSQPGQGASAFKPTSAAAKAGWCQALQGKHRAWHLGTARLNLRQVGNLAAYQSSAIQAT